MSGTNAHPFTEGQPSDVGILAIEVYFPRTKVDQEDLEAFDGVASGKYTIGLGQHSMAFIGDQEDVVSMSLTVVQSLMEKFSVAPAEIGRLEVGTESSIDRSKSVKSFLMSLFSSSGNCDVQGVDCVNACFGGTAALFNAVNWVESRSWDGRYAMVVAADVAVYASGPARASGGCGAVAMLVGPDAPLVLEPGYSAAYMDNVYDFYKPSGIFPQVEGKLSVICYLTAVDRCYARLCQKVGRLRARQSTREEVQATADSFDLSDIDFCVMHAPFAKMVRKGYARLLVQDCLRERQRHGLAVARDPSLLAEAGVPASSSKPADALDAYVVALQADTTAPALAPWAGSATSCHSTCLKPHCQTRLQAAHSDLHRILDELGDATASEVSDKRIERAAIEASTRDFELRTTPGMLLGLECGNMYAASVHASLASLVHSKGQALEDKRILASSFGSGLASTIFCIYGRATAGRFSLENIAKKLDLRQRLAQRRTASPSEFTAAVAALERAHGKAGYKPCDDVGDLFPGTYYLQEVDDKFRRQYCRRGRV